MQQMKLKKEKEKFFVIVVYFEPNRHTGFLGLLKLFHDSHWQKIDMLNK